MIAAAGREITKAGLFDPAGVLLGRVSDAGADARTRILVKPVAEDLATNLVIVTDRRAYHLELTSTPENLRALSGQRSASAGECAGDKLDHGSGGLIPTAGRSKRPPPVAFDLLGDGRPEDVQRGSLSACSTGVPC